MAKTAHRIFEAMNDLAEARHIYVREKPKYGLTLEQKKSMKSRLSKAKKAIAEIEKMVAKK